MYFLRKTSLIYFLLSFLFSFGQTPAEELPEHSNAVLLMGEPEVCSVLSLQSPSNLRYNVLENGIMLKWNPVPRTFGCKVIGGIVGEEQTSRYKEGYELDKIFFAFSSLQPEKEYEWKVQCNCKTSPWSWGEESEISSLRTPNFNLPYDLDQANKVLLFPNPAQDELYLHFNREVGENAFIEVYSVNGVVQNKMNLKSGLNFINTSEMERGYYILFIHSMVQDFKLSFVKT